MKSTGPIIKSLADTDIYKLTMMQVAYHQYTGAEVEYRFRCRTAGINLVPYMNEIEEEIAAYCDLQFTNEELGMIASLRYIKRDFVEFLEIYRPRMKHIKVERSHIESGAIDIVVSGPWVFTIPFEVPVLAIVQEVYWRNNCDMKEAMIKGKQNLIDKIKRAESHKQYASFRFSDFGTRRRFSREWHEVVVGLARDMMPLQLTGSSNILLANRYQLVTVGTHGHEFFMAHQQLGPRLRDSQIAALNSWVTEFEGDLGTALTDVVGRKQFFEDFSLLASKAWDGLRMDSGDPYEWTDDALAHYKSMRIDATSKSFVYSDGLNFQKALDIQEYVDGRAKAFFGIGTDLTNDVGVIPLNNVMKMTLCNGQPVAKISDSPGKSMCTDPSFEAYLASVFKVDGYKAQ